MPEKFKKPYDPKTVEPEIYKRWEDSGYFNPDNLPGRHQEPFSIVLPPPNVTGTLHVGHAYEDSLQDSLIRYQRMRGKKALWIPGADSAAISTQARVEKDIQKNENEKRPDSFIAITNGEDNAAYLSETTTSTWYDSKEFSRLLLDEPQIRKGIIER